MKIEKVVQNGQVIAVASGECGEIADVQAALDLMMTAQYETGSKRLALDKTMLTEEFFVLRTGLAGEILQKFVNYQFRVAIFGDFSGYTSKPLRDFIRESNQGNAIYFTANKEEAVSRLYDVL